MRSPTSTLTPLLARFKYTVLLHLPQCLLQLRPNWLRVLPARGKASRVAK